MITKIIKLSLSLALAAAFIGGCAPADQAESAQQASQLAASPTQEPAPTQAEPTQPEPSEEPTLAPSPTDEMAEPQATPAEYQPEGLPLQPLDAGQEVAISEVHMLDLERGWAIGGATYDGAHILRTEDGGQHWLDVTPPEPAATADQPDKSAVAYFMDFDTAWVTYGYQGQAPTPGQAVVWRTQDGGQSWLPSELLNTGGLDEFFVPGYLTFVQDEVGWLLVHVGAGMSKDYVVIYQTLDGGETWQRLLDPYQADEGQAIQSCRKTDMVFADAVTGWLTKDCFGVIDGAHIEVTQDGGNTWQRQQLPPPEGNDRYFTMPFACSTEQASLFSPSSGRLVVACSNYEGEEINTTYWLYVTTDGGDSWDIYDYPGGNLTWLDPQLGYAQSQDIYQTSNGGQTWTLVKNVSWDGQFSWVDGSHAWAVARSGDEGALVQTENGGDLWTELSPMVVAETGE